MQRIGAIVAWAAAAAFGAGVAAMWTGVVLLFMQWPLYTLAVAAVVVVSTIAMLAHGGRCHRLEQTQPSTGQLVVALPRKVGVTELREILGEETFLELSSLAEGPVND